MLTLQRSSTAFDLQKGAEVSADVYEQNDGGLVIYLSFISVSEKPLTAVTIRHKDPTDFFTSVPALTNSSANDISSAALYEYEDLYALIVWFNISKSTLSKRLSYIPGLTFSRIKAEKIREYGKLISDSPLELFI